MDKMDKAAIARIQELEEIILDQATIIDLQREDITDLKVQLNILMRDRMADVA